MKQHAHTAFTLMDRRGVPVEVIRRVAGHASLVTTSLYLGSNDEFMTERVGDAQLTGDDQSKAKSSS